MRIVAFVQKMKSCHQELFGGPEVLQDLRRDEIRCYCCWWWWWS